MGERSASGSFGDGRYRCIHVHPGLASMTDPTTERNRQLIERHGGPDSARPSPWQLTPLMACRLIVAAEERADDIAEGRIDVLAEALPPLVHATATPEFCARFRRCYVDLAEWITAADTPGDGWPFLAHCVGEEVALADVLATAADDHDSGHFDDLYAGEIEQLTTDPERDTDFDYYEDALFKDTDFKVLWSPHLDGIEDDETIAARLGYANLQPSRWFLPFDPETF